MAVPYYRPYFPATYNYGANLNYNPALYNTAIPAGQFPTQPAAPQQIENHPPANGFSWVDGINAAKAQNIGYGTSWVFFDSKEPYFYIKTVDPDGRPQPLYIASYKQINESDLPTADSAAKPTFDTTNFVRKEDLDMSKYVTKDDIAKILDAIATNNKNYLTYDNLEEKVTQILQSKIGAPTPLQNLTVKEE